ncbi:MAG: efflux transporter, family, subunit [bacterium]|nr:efflux transporter, family, subunit [bacterium]
MRTAFFALALLLTGCEHSSEAPAAAASGGSDPVAALDTVQVTSEKLDTTAKLPGELAPYEMVALYPRVSGFVEDVSVDRGSVVKRGQLLARLSAPELASQRSEAESKLLAVRSTSERMRAASDTPGAVAKHDLELADSAVKADEARVQSLKTLESYLYVRAPFDGVITERNVHPGALVGPPAGANATPMLRMESVGHLRLTVAVPETDVGSIAEGAKAEFVVRTWPGQRFVGVIKRVAHAIDSKTRTMPVELDVENVNGKLAPGMFADVFWPIRRDAPSLFVPPSAIVQTTERTYVDRVRDGTIEQVTVQRGTTLKDRVEVFGPLQAGDTILKRGSEELKGGAKVKTKP